ncbi:MAG TPA: hypothetical protein VJ876_08155, partial [Bacteroidales bacterium]|nr:hypothetical protein [Bacteroidales bacterium]
MKNTYLVVLGFLGLFFFPFWVVGQDADVEENDQPRWSLFAEWRTYNSFSQQNNEVPMKAGYPVIQAQMPAFGVCYRLPFPNARHQFNLSFGLPAGLDSDDGTGENQLLRESLMGYYRAGLGYHLTFPLFKWRRLSVRHGGTSGLLYEYRSLEYLSGAREKARDINMYLGPALYLNYHLNEKWSLHGGFDARF